MGTFPPPDPRRPGPLPPTQPRPAPADERPEMKVETPENGWFPEESQAPMTQLLFRAGKPIANIVRSGVGWRGYSLVELNKSGTTGKPLGDGWVGTREEAKKQAEDYADSRGSAA